MPNAASFETDTLQRYLALDLARVAERAAVAAARLRGRGDEMAADEAAVRAMRAELALLPVRGRVVIGQGEQDAAPALFLGEELGAAETPRVDIAVAPLEGSTLCAKDMSGAIAIVAMARVDALLRAPDMYMDKIAIGPGYPPGVVDLDKDPSENIAALARARGVEPSAITVCVLDRPRHAELVARCRRAGACVRLISDGDVAGVIVTAQSGKTGVDMYLGRGGAHEGVLAAAALRCVGGQMQGRLVVDSADSAARAARIGIEDPYRKYSLDDLVRGDVIVCATGVTDGPLLSGVVFDRDIIQTETLIYRSATGTVRRMRAEHRASGKFD